MKTTVAEDRRIVRSIDTAHKSAAIEYLILWHDGGWCSGPGSGVHRPAEDYVGRITRSARTALRAAAHGERVYVAPAGRYRRRDVLVIYDGRDIAAELGCGNSSYDDLVLLKRVFRAWMPDTREAAKREWLERVTWGNILAHANRPDYLAQN